MTTTATTPREHLSALDLAMAEVAALETACEELALGITTWSEVYPDLTCPDRQEVAYRECERELDAARERLTRLRAASRTETGN